MKVYFTAATGRTIQYRKFYKTVVAILSELEAENTNPYNEALIKGRKEKAPLPKDLYKIALKSVINSDLLLVDISEPSISLGILIEFARNNNVPVLCICEKGQEERIPRILLNRKNSLVFSLLIYEKDSIERQLIEYFESFKKNKIKFNVFISPEMDSYMKWVAKHNKYASKSDFFRDLIEKHMQENPEYSK